MGKTISLSDVRVENEDSKLLAHGTVTLMTLPALTFEGQDSQPTKFL